MTEFNQNKTVSVIIPHFDDKAGLTACLESLSVQSYPGENVEIIVADNDTPGGVYDIAERFPDARFISVTERGAAAARNAAMATASGEIFAFIDADCVAHSDWLLAGVKSLSAADYVGGRIDVTVRNQNAPSPVEAFEVVFGFRQRMYIERKNFSATANLFVHRHVAEAIGPFVNGLAEDYNWGRRAHKLGFRLEFNDNPVVQHPARPDWPSLVLKWDRLTRERWSGFRRQRSSGRLGWTLLAAVTALSATPHLWMVFASGKLSRFHDKIAAASVLMRIRFWRARRMIEMLGAE